jgi:hypothetical protein
VASDGGIFAFGDAAYWGSTGSQHLNQPIVGMVATPDGRGYWLVASDGGIFAFGDAAFWGSTGSQQLNQPVVGMAATPDGRGYWLVASDGGIFAFGDAAFWGSTGAQHLNKPVVGVAPTGDGQGYWLVASDGGIFAFGDAAFAGSAAGLTGTGSAVGLEASPDGAGYWAADSNGGVFTFGDAVYFGSAGGIALRQPVVGMATTFTPAINSQDFGITGNTTVPLLPGTTSSVDLQFTNPNPAPITVVSEATTVTTSSGACTPSNFAIAQDLHIPVTVPAGSTVTLSSLGIPPDDWPAVGMLDTGSNQDSCQGVQLTLHYQGQAIG